jgi:hypothetical protein
MYVHTSGRHAYTEDAEFQQHCLSVVKAIGKAVSLMSNVDELVPMLRKLGAVHSKFDVRPEHWAAFGQALLWMIQNALGRAWNQDVRNGWSQMFSTIRTVMEPCMRQENGARNTPAASPSARASQPSTPAASTPQPGHSATPNNAPSSATRQAAVASDTPQSAKQASSSSDNPLRAVQLVGYTLHHTTCY